MGVDAELITAHKQAMARVTRLEDKLLDLAGTGSAPAPEEPEEVRRLRAALAQAYQERNRTQTALFPQAWARA